MRKLASAAAAFAAAIFLAQYAGLEKWLPLCAAVCAALSLAGLLFHGDSRLRIMLICLGLAAGFLYNLGYSAVFYAPARELDGRRGSVSAYVCDYPEQINGGSRTTIRIKPAGKPSVKAAMYSLDGDMPTLLPGDTITLTADFELADELYGVETDYYSSRGFFLFAYPDGEITVTSPGGGLRTVPVRTAKILKDKISEIFAPDMVGFMRALLTGDRTIINADSLLTSAMQTSGISHVISVSGMHIAFLIGFLALLIKKKRALALVGIPVILFFMAFIGFTPSVCRAGIMQIFILTAPLVRRENDPLTALFFALALILAFNPYSAASIGLQLSFAACLGIILFTGKIYSALFGTVKDKKLCTKKPMKAAILFVIASVATTLGALAFTVPLTAIYFGYVSLVAPLANILTLWAVSLAFCGGYIACLIGFVFVPLGSAAAAVVSLPVRYVIWAVSWLSDMPFAAVYTSNPAIICWLVYVYIMLIAFFALRGTLRQLLYPTCAAAISLCAILLLTALAPAVPAAASLVMTVLDVGHGQSIVLTDGNCTVAVDCGSSSRGDAGSVTGGYLYGAGRQKIDLLILTHYHDDHTNGVEKLLDMTQVESIALPAPDLSGDASAREVVSLAENRGISVIYVTEDMTVDFGGGIIYLFAPLGADSENECGISVLCSENGCDTLITGDAPASVEYMLLDHAALPDIEVLVVGHHGSAASSSQELLDTVMPEIAVISVGENDYGHPSQLVLDRLAASGVTVYRTDESGAVTFTQ